MQDGRELIKAGTATGNLRTARSISPARRTIAAAMSRLSARARSRHQGPSLDQKSLLGLLGYNCRRVYLRIFALFRERMAKFNLRPVEYSVLVLVRDNPNVNQKRLGRALGIDPPNMGALLERLKNRRLLLRNQNPEDKRAQLLVLTAKGGELCRKAERVVTRLELDATPQLTKGERAELMRLAQKVFLH